jgi:hypothetical protein
MNNYPKLFIFFIVTLFIPNIGFANEVSIEDREPVIKQCLKDRICTCQDMGGDVYDDGLRVQCVFYDYTVESAYSYFVRFHTPKLSALLFKKIPTSNKHLIKKNKDTTSDTMVNYILSEKNKNLKIEVDFIYGGYNYIFTPKGNDTILEFLYFSYN